MQYLSQIRLAKHTPFPSMRHKLLLLPFLAVMLLGWANGASAQAPLALPKTLLRKQQRQLQARNLYAPDRLIQRLMAPPLKPRPAQKPITRLLIKLKPGIDHRNFALRFSATAKHNPLLTNSLLPNKAALKFVRTHSGIPWSTFEVPTPEALAPTLQALKADPGVLLAEPDYRILRLNLAPPNNHYWGIPDWENIYAVWGLGDSDEASAYNDDSTTFNFSWSFEQVSALEAWNVYPGHYHTAAERLNLLKTDPARLPLVGDIDTGVDLTHPDFSYTGNPSKGIIDTDVRHGGQLNIQFARSFVGPTKDGYQGEDPTLAMDDYGHGTATTSIIGAAANTGANDAAWVANNSNVTWTKANVQVYPNAMTGLGFPAQVVPIKVVDAAGDGSDSDILDAILYASADWLDPATGIVHPSPHCSILNMSLALDTTDYPQALQDAVDFAWNHGTLIVAAAGNDGAAAGGPGYNTPRYPARCDKVLTVSATTYDYPDGGVPEQITSYSDYGPQVGVCAPGGDAAEYQNNATGDFAIDPVPELILPFVLQPSYLVVLNDPNGTSADSAYAVDGFAGLYVGELPGTSFAAPHVAGLAALYASEHRITQSSANGPQQIVNAIERGADSLNGLTNGGYDPTYGWGRINAAATVADQNNRNATVGGCIGRLRYVDTVVGNVNVSATAASGGTAYSVTTASDGLYHLVNLPCVETGTLYNVTATVFGTTATIQVTIYPGCDQLGVNLTAGIPTVSNVAVAPTTVLGGLNATGTVTINVPAPTGGVVVSLSTNGSTVASTMPNSITIPAGKTTANFAITTTAVATLTTVTLTAASGTSKQAVTFNVRPIRLRAMHTNPGTVVGGKKSKGTVYLEEGAGPGPLTVTLSSDNTAASLVSSTITIPVGATTGTFWLTTAQVKADTVANISASLNGSTLKCKQTIIHGVLAGFKIPHNTVTGDESTTGIITLNSPAGSGGVTVTLSSNNSAAVPATTTITIPEGQVQGYFTLNTVPVTVDTTTIITVLVGPETRSAALTVLAPVVSGVQLTPSTVKGGNLVTVLVLLTGKVAAATTVPITNTNAAVTMPTQMVIAPGGHSRHFDVRTKKVTATATGTVTATLGGSQSATLTITP